MTQPPCGGDVAVGPLDDFPVGLVRLDAQGCVQAHNAAWAALVGPTAVGADLAQQLHPEDVAAWRRTLLELGTAAGHAHAHARALRLRCVTAQNQLRWLDIDIAGVHAPAGAAGATPMLAMAARDATTQQREEAAVRTEARSLRNLVHGIPGLVYRGRNDRDWTMEIVSAGCRGLTGHAAEDVRNSRKLSYSSLILAQDVDYVWDRVQEAMRTHTPYALSYRIRRADGRVQLVFERGQGIYSDSGEVLGIEGVMFAMDAALAQRAARLADESTGDA